MVGEHDSNIRFLTVSKNMAASRMRNEKYAIWPLVMAESPTLVHSSAMELLNRLWGRCHVPQNVLLVFLCFTPVRLRYIGMFTEYRYTTIR